MLTFCTNFLMEVYSSHLISTLEQKYPSFVMRDECELIGLLNAETGYQKLPRLCPSSALRQSVMRESSNGLFSSLKEAWDTESSREGNSLSFSTNTKCLIYKRVNCILLKKIKPQINAESFKGTDGLYVLYKHHLKKS